MKRGCKARSGVFMSLLRDRRESGWVHVRRCLTIKPETFSTGVNKRSSCKGMHWLDRVTTSREKEVVATLRKLPFWRAHDENTLQKLWPAE